MAQNCPRCRRELGANARFCAWCGVDLTAGALAGFIKHPQALRPPEGFAAFSSGSDLFFRWRSAWGERRLISTEPVIVTVFNGGYDLATLDILVEARDAAKHVVGSREASLALLRRGVPADFEFASYDIDAPFHDLVLSLVRAEFAPEASDS